MTAKSAVCAALLGAAVTASSAHADLPGAHPGLLHALTDVRSARWLVEHRPADQAVTAHEDRALQAMTAAISDLQRAAIDDGKNLDVHPPMDAPPSRQGRLERALNLLDAAHKDVDAAESDAAARTLRPVALKNIDAAAAEIKAALWDVGHNR